MSKNMIEVEGQKTCKSPALAWQNKNFRIVVIYNTSGSDPLIQLERMVGVDGLGEEAWVKYDTPKDLPVDIIKDLAIHASGDSNILKN